MQLPVQQDGHMKALEGGEPDKQAAVEASSPTSPGSPSKSIRDKPVKVLPCPRCESMNTKFCYYNNYSVNQPRHFCRQCQRYWTVGGTLRNVPVGGGSRKKNRHQRVEPYLRTSAGSGGSPLAMVSSGSQPVMQNGFQQLLTQDMVGMNFSQLPGYGHQNHYLPYSLDQNQGLYTSVLNKPVLSQPEMHASAMHAMYGTQTMNPPVLMNGAYFNPDMEALQQVENLGHVTPKSEYWGNAVPQPQQVLGNNHQTPGVWEQSRHTSASPHSVVDDEGNNTGKTPPQMPKGGVYESSMLLHLGLNTRPQVSGKPSWEEVKPGQQTNGSPPHGSSTIEEEGSTPTNGYSNSGYEEGDAVSSMWHDMHDMHDIFQ